MFKLRCGIDLRLGNCLDVMKSMSDNSVDAIVTDPPYGLSFMGKKWDYDVPSQEIWEEALRVLKPGGYLLSFAGTRTQHRMAVRIEDAGFEIRDMIAWVYGSGFPKSLNIGKAVDKLQGNEREDLGESENNRDRSKHEYNSVGNVGSNARITKGTSEWEGWGTALKPALEPITVARKPLSEKNVAENVLKWGVGGIDIDGCRVATDELTPRNNNNTETLLRKGFEGESKTIEPSPLGRFPANLIHDGSDEVVGLFPNSGSGNGEKRVGKKGGSGFGYFDDEKTKNTMGVWHNDSGSASRFFKKCELDDLCSLCFCAKSDKIHPCQKEKSAQIAKYVGNLCDSCAIYFAQKLAVITDNQGVVPSQEESQAIQDFITDYKNYTLLQNLVLCVEAMDNTDTTQTTKDLLKLFGSANRVIINYIQKIEKSESKRFLYQAKASKSERNRGCEGLEKKPVAHSNQAKAELARGNTDFSREVDTSSFNSVKMLQNSHPTVKPIALMEYLVKLVSREGAVVLDPFMGSGSTGIACRNLKRNFIGIEMSEEYLKIAEARINSVHQEGLI